MNPTRPLALLVALAGAGLAAMPPAHAATGGTVPGERRLDDTGMTLCTRDYATLTADCEGTGQDADQGRDVAMPDDADGPAGFVFVKVCNSGEAAGHGRCPADPAQGDGPDAWGCTRDRVTGLTWELATAGNRGRRYTNRGDGGTGDASAHVAALVAAARCGGQDWRLPTTQELLSLVDFQARGGRSLAPTWFPDGIGGLYWSSDAWFRDPTLAWLVSYVGDEGGFVGNHVGDRNTAEHLRLVRPAPAPAPAPARAPVRFAAAGDVVADATSRLVWMRCSVGQAFDGRHCVGRVRFFDLPDALAFARAQAERTGEAWRLPNVKELYSLVDLAIHSPAIDHGTFPDTPRAQYWTSTNDVHFPDNFSAVQFSNGDLLDNGYWQSRALRLVRDAP